ncbi:MAG: hypothetical protein KatS3mg033_0555 [Thermonema sp.]|uniref:hypothetical protein n=1 Tax=Thermonema sp. TaxID=2231181 RepID=UPI0021DB9203|nr:hypothetical protein [Thermonema sp.]GIV38755.1 MAG: hypothetical protein KatS3mg033_0555 [Thermonema sp.]
MASWIEKTEHFFQKVRALSPETKYEIGNAVVVAGICSIFMFPGYPGLWMSMLIVGSIIKKRFRWVKKKGYRFGHRKDKRRGQTVKKGPLTDEQIVRFARIKGGVITPAELALETSLSVEEAEERLIKLHSKGFNEIKVSDKGFVVYDFHCVLPSLDDKINAKKLDSF